MLVLMYAACTDESLEEPFDCSSSDLTLQVVSVTKANCSSADGQIEVSATGGTANYLFSINGGDPQASGVFTGLSAGTYQVLVSDGQCEKSMEVIVETESGLSASIAGVSPSGCETSNGSISVAVSGGTEPYAYQINEGAPSTSSTFSSLAQGSYSITVTDDQGCQVNLQANVESGISYASNVQSIMQSDCATSGCHNGNNSLPNFNDFNTVQNNAGSIKSRTQSGSMPPGGRTISQSQINAIACWVDDGAKNN